LERRSIARFAFAERASCPWRDVSDCAAGGECAVVLLDSPEFHWYAQQPGEVGRTYSIEVSTGETSSRPAGSRALLRYWSDLLHRGEVTVEGLPSALGAWSQTKTRERQLRESDRAVVSPVEPGRVGRNPAVKGPGPAEPVSAEPKSRRKLSRPQTEPVKAAEKGLPRSSPLGSPRRTRRWYDADDDRGVPEF
jgi:hypothetical protein